MALTCIPEIQDVRMKWVTPSPAASSSKLS